jgi:protein TonB
VSLLLHAAIFVLPAISFSINHQLPQIAVQVGLVSVPEEAFTSFESTPSRPRATSPPDALAFHSPVPNPPTRDESQSTDAISDASTDPIHEVERPLTPAVDVPTEPIDPVIEPLTLQATPETLGQDLAPVAVPSESRVGTPTQQPGVRVHAKLKSTDRPIYPTEAIQHHWEGLVIIRVRVTVQGNSASAEIVQSSGHPILDESALQFARSARFEPATDQGFPTENEEMLPIRYRLTRPPID